MATTTHRPKPNSGPAPKARIPHLPSTLLAIREHLGWSRAKAYSRHGVSGSYLSQIEDGTRTPSLDLLQQMISGYNLTCSQSQYLHDLRAPSRHLSPTPDLRQFIARTSQLVRHLDDLDQRSVPAAYVNPLKQILATNHTWRRTLPGMYEIGCIPEWLFSPAGQATVLDWHNEARYSVASIRPGLARYRDTEQAHTVLATLANNPAFNEIWHASVDVIYGRDTSSPLQCHHPDSGERYSLTLSLSLVTQTQEVLLVTAVPRAFEPA
ncbi:helix-turn-helix domain-containing protein [Nocardia testacea]|uniref:MmyB family transcriptional regulator n=1 Tax=Nocardia testacea TaxID=248551 RepID=UPI003A88201A